MSLPTLEYRTADCPDLPRTLAVTLSGTQSTQWLKTWRSSVVREKNAATFWFQLIPSELKPQRFCSPIVPSKTISIEKKISKVLAKNITQMIYPYGRNTLKNPGGPCEKCGHCIVRNNILKSTMKQSHEWCYGFDLKKNCCAVDFWILELSLTQTSHSKVNFSWSNN